jgi:large conductance mechanosensitive channel protein
MLKGFQQFILRGNVLDLAVAVVMGAAFGGVVTALVKDLLTPLIAAIVGQPDFSAIAFEVNGSKFLVGDFINALVAFLLIAAAVGGVLKVEIRYSLWLISHYFTVVSLLISSIISTFRTLPSIHIPDAEIYV